MIKADLVNNFPSTRSALACSQPSAAVTPPKEIQVSDFCPCDYSCDYEEVALADDSGDPLKNDYYSILIDLTVQGDNVVFTLINKITKDEFVLNNDTYGKYYPKNTFADNPLKAGFIVEWSKVLSLIGTGVYSVRIDQTTFGNTITTESHKFRLYNYSFNIADRTVRVETESNGYTEGGFNYYGTNWKRSVRFYGYVYGRNPVLESNRIEYNNRNIEQIQDKLITEWKIETKPVPQSIYLPLIYDKMLADNIYMTSYNLFGEQDINRVNVYFDGVEDHKEWSKSLLASWTLKVIEKKQNIIKRWRS